MLITRFVVWMFSGVMMVLGAGTASGQDYPNKPLRIVTATAGGGGDFVARIIAQGISGPLGQPVIIDNRAAGFTPGLIASQALPDGYTLLVTGTNHYVSTLLRPAPYDPIKDFSSISIISIEPNVLAVHPSVAATSVKELIALAKAKPGVLNYSSNGVGSSTHMSTEIFKTMAGIDIVHIPYKGTAQAVTDLVSGLVQIRIGSINLVAPHFKSGKLRALAVTSTQPSARLPGVPTVAATVPGYDFTSGVFIFAPTKTPVAIINRLNQEVVRALNLPDVKEKIFNTGQEIVASSPQELATYLKLDITRIGKVIKDLGIQAD